MKKTTKFFSALMLAAAMLTACGAPAATEPSTTEPPVTETVNTTPVETTAPVETTVPTEPAPQENVSAEGYNPEYVRETYAEQIGRYYVALAEQWTEEQYFDAGMSGLAAYYYEGDPLANVGFGYQDLNNDGQEELIIGAILNAEQAPSVFEIWTLVDGAPVMLAQGGARNRYILQFVEEDNMWYVANEASNSAFSSGTYSLMLIDGKLEVTQGIVFDATVDENNPWYMTYDLDWDVSNDEPIDEDMANAILENDRRYYTAIEYIPYNLYK
ncbi:MAG: hypothetical protein IKU31_02530 [Oscillospiraceae bacterium]|nr:hypothetical protein [Oscillospiraceae bacterium]